MSQAPSNFAARQWITLTPELDILQLKAGSPSQAIGGINGVGELYGSLSAVEGAPSQFAKGISTVNYPSDGSSLVLVPAQAVSTVWLVSAYLVCVAASSDESLGEAIFLSFNPSTGHNPSPLELAGTGLQFVGDSSNTAGGLGEVFTSQLVPLAAGSPITFAVASANNPPPETLQGGIYDFYIVAQRLA